MKGTRRSQSRMQRGVGGDSRRMREQELVWRARQQEQMKWEQELRIREEELRRWEEEEYLRRVDEDRYIYQYMNDILHLFLLGTIEV